MKKLTSLLALSLVGVTFAAGCTLSEGPGGTNGLFGGASSTGGQDSDNSGGSTSGSGASSNLGGMMNAGGATGGSATGGTSTGGTDALNCDKPDKPTGDELELAGASQLAAKAYTDADGVPHNITWDLWESGDTPTDWVNLSYVDNTANFAVGKNDTTNQFDACLWSRYDWTEAGATLYYCLTVTDATTEDAAINATSPDSSDPTKDGCNGFAWTELTLDP